ncbi:MAG: flagellin lysine-N-methylase, partial [Lachnospiraceae bacterium]|nr:flagellin lysine-N-methylase [Lachnospiraceae bacterium]
MRKVYPHYYNEFSCIADKCPDTCCAGWQIVIDDASLERYEQYVGAFDDRLNEGIDWSEGCFKQDEKKRCSMLNDRNLCDMVLKMGEKHLCRTCALYPRHVEEFEGLREWSLSLSCPVAAHMVLSCREPVRFIEEQNDDDDPLISEFDDFDFLLFTELEDARDVLYRIIQNREMSIPVRLRCMLSLARQLQICVEENRISDMQAIIAGYGKALDAGEDPSLEDDLVGEVDLSDPGCRYEMLQEYFFAFSKLELMREDWQAVLDAEKNLLAKGEGAYTKIYEAFAKETEGKEWWPIFQENYLMSFVYTYFCGAVYDDWIDTKVMLAVFSAIFT